jgi:predicted nucleic acid-binding protein
MAGLRGGVNRTLVLDARGLARLAAGDPAVRAMAASTQRLGGTIVTAASTLAEVLRGGPLDAPLHQALNRVRVVPVDRAAGRRAGELLGSAGAPGQRGTADALLAVIALAQERPVVLLTSDPDGMARLTGEPGRRGRERIAVVAIED